jgi:hypothetical protein
MLGSPCQCSVPGKGQSTIMGTQENQDTPQMYWVSASVECEVIKCCHRVLYIALRWLNNLIGKALSLCGLTFIASQNLAYSWVHKRFGLLGPAWQHCSFHDFFPCPTIADVKEGSISWNTDIEKLVFSCLLVGLFRMFDLVGCL